MRKYGKPYLSFALLPAGCLPYSGKALVRSIMSRCRTEHAGIPVAHQPAFNWTRFFHEPAFQLALKKHNLILIVQVPIMLALATVLRWR